MATRVRGIVEATRRNDIKELTRLLDQDPSLVNVVIEEDRKRTPLLYAAMGGHVDACRLLLGRGADLSLSDRHGGSALHYAVAKGHEGVLRLLLKHGADQQAILRGACTPLAIAALRNQLPALLILLGHMGRLEGVWSSSGSRALFAAVIGGHANIAKALLMYGANAQCPCQLQGETFTAEQYARAKRKDTCVEVLEWFRGELEKAELLFKCRLLVENEEVYTKAPLKAGATTPAQARDARLAAVATWARGRVERGEAMPRVEATEKSGAKRRFEGGGYEASLLQPVVKCVLEGMKEGPFMDLMEMLQMAHRGR